MTGDAWGDNISDERKAELERKLQAWEQEVDRGEHEGPFSGFYLTGADVMWLASRTPPPKPVGGVILGGTMPILTELHLEGANLSRVRLQGAQLYGVHLEDAELFGAHLEDANLSQARLEGARLMYARLQGTILNGTHLERADLTWANLEATESIVGIIIEGVFVAMLVQRFFGGK